MKLPKIFRPKRSSGFEDSSPGASPSSSSSSPKSKRSFGLLSPKSPKSPSFALSPKSKGFMSPKADALASSSSASTTAITAELEAVFRLFDSNCDGRICTSELEAVLKCLGDAPTDEELAKIVQEVDYDGDGFISLEEFMQFNGGSAASSSELKAAFHVFDIDRNGFISADELHRVLVGLGDKDLTMEDCGRMIRGVDSNGDGRVDFEEFKVMMASA